MAKPVIGGDGIGKPAHLFGFNLTDNEWKAALIDDDGALVTSGAAAAGAWPSALASESSADTSASTDWVDLITLSLTMPADGYVLAHGHSRARSATYTDYLGLRVVIGAYNGDEMIYGGTSDRYIDYTADHRYAIAAGAVTVKLQGRRSSGSGTFTFDYKQLLAWAMPA